MGRGSAGRGSALRRIVIGLPRGAELVVEGRCIARATAENHDGSIRRLFALYSTADGWACERIDDPGCLDERRWGASVADTAAVYDFFGNEPLANYLYGLAGIDVPGLRDCLDIRTSALSN